MSPPTLPRTPLPRAGNPLEGRRIAGRYRIDRAIGRGGMGVVYAATHVGLDKRVAVKFIAEKYTADEDALARFHREARAASRIGHEHIVDVTDIGEDEDGRCFIVMELLEGADLGQVLRDAGPMPGPRALSIAHQLLAGLGAAHAAGIVHRDMKPENVFLARRGERTDVVKIMDFGISKFITAHESKVRLTETGAILGTPVYMSPEQAQAAPDVDHRADLYALGVMLYEMLAGQPPFQAPSYLALVTQHLHETPPPLAGFRPDLPAALVDAVHRALSKDPAHRFPDCAAFAAALPPPGDWVSAFDSASTLTSDGGVPLGVPRTAAAATAVPPRRSRWLALGAALLVGAAALATTLALGRESAEPVAASASASAAATAALRIASMPDGAEVSIDGEPVGTTPLDLAEVAVGERAIRIAKPGFTDVVLDHQVRGGTHEVVTAVLSPAAGRDAGADEVVAADAGRAAEPTPPEPGAERRARPKRPEERPPRPEHSAPATEPEPGTERGHEASPSRPAGGERARPEERRSEPERTTPAPTEVEGARKKSNPYLRR